MNLAQAIKDARKKKALTVSGAAQKACVSQSYWEKLEAGQMLNPSIAILARIAAALDTPLEQLVPSLISA